VDALELIREQTANADRIMRQVFEQVTPEQAAWRSQGSMANTIGATFLHVYAGEDRLIQQTQGAAPIFESGGWRERLGYDTDAVWTYTGGFDPRLLSEYADAVAASTKGYLSGLKSGDLETLVETPRGQMPWVNRLNIYLVSHKFQHTGEIAALLGCQGVKGLPF
jgi:uncharacterized damage-inducible protein DinB